MKRYNEDFLDKIKGFNLQVLENSKYPIYALSKELKFIYFNPAWSHFAKDNQFEGRALKNLSLGSPYLKSIKGVWLKLYFQKNYKKVIRTGETWHHEYQCSSNEFYRFYHQTAYPLLDKSGVLIVNTEVFKLPMDQMNIKTFEVIIERYTQPNNRINQCSNCRHTQRADEPDLWDWVPNWVEKLPINSNLSICPTCKHLYEDS
ncbi:hypothetical protein [Maribacter polysiphoniae]|uniref:hypothetical protein n=1 Tax=Maribacter polysiphoniae TaxID=429344 RepID=UPI0023578D29|nr:hypothetical protein [Maribacter polysiphoniae]